MIPDQFQAFYVTNKENINMATTKSDRCAVVLVNKGTRKTMGLLVADASPQHARGFCRHFNQRIKRTWPDRRAVAIPVV